MCPVPRRARPRGWHLVHTGRGRAPARARLCLPRASPLPAARLAPGLTRQRLAHSRPQGLGPNPETRPDPRSAPRAGPLPRLQLALTSAGRLLNVRCPSWTAVTLFLFCCCLLAGNSKLCPETPRATRSAFLKGTQLLRSRPRAPRPGLSVLVVLLRVFPRSVINF